MFVNIYKSLNKQTNKEMVRKKKKKRERNANQL